MLHSHIDRRLGREMLACVHSANYAFSLETFHHFVAPLMADEAEWEPAWDEVLGIYHDQHCGFWMPRPLVSNAQHITNKEGLHYERDGEREGGKLFPWDDFNWALIYNINPEIGPSRCTPCSAKTCTAGGEIDGGVALINGMCPAFCSRNNYCGRTRAYQERDCRGCEKEATRG